MSAVTFDTLKLAQNLRDRAKFSPEQAEQTAMAVAESFTEWQEKQQLATKADIRETELRLKLHIGGMIVALGGILIAIRYFG